MNFGMKRGILALAALMTMCGGVANAQEKNALEGKKLPAFTMKDLSGKAVTNASIKGKVVIFDFWATWCGPCIQASPTMQALHKKFASKGLVVIGAKVLDEEGSASDYAKKHKYTYKFTTGGDGLFGMFKVPGIPTFVFVDKKGMVNKVAVGFDPNRTPAEFEKRVQTLLAAK